MSDHFHEWFDGETRGIPTLDDYSAALATIEQLATLASTPRPVTSAWTERRDWPRQMYRIKIEHGAARFERNWAYPGTYDEHLAHGWFDSPSDAAVAALNVMERHPVLSCPSKEPNQ